MARTSKDLSARIGSVERSLQRLSQDFLTGSRRLASLPEEIEQVTASLETLRPLPGCPEDCDLNSAKAAAARHQSGKELAGSSGDAPDTGAVLRGCLNSVQAEAARLHTLVESAFGLHCGALLTNPAVEITYTPAGEMYTAGEANLSVDA